MEEENKSQEPLNASSSPSPSTSTHATASESHEFTNRSETSHEQNSVTEIPSYIFDAMSLVSISSQQHQFHQQQLQQFHQQQLYSFQSEGAMHFDSQLHHFYNAQRESMNSPPPQYYPLLQGHLPPLYQDAQQQHHHHSEQLQQHPSSPLRTNYFSSPRNDCTIHVAAGKSPTENMNLARKFLIHHETVYLSAFDAAIVIAIDAALLIQRSKYATITRVETDTEDRVEMQHPSNSPSFASIVKRPQIRITLQRNEEFVQWLTDNQNDVNGL